MPFATVREALVLLLGIRLRLSASRTPLAAATRGPTREAVFSHEWFLAVNHALSRGELGRGGQTATRWQRIKPQCPDLRAARGGDSFGTAVARATLI